MRIAMVSEHASPLATVGGVDAGGQNVHVAALACELARRGHEVEVFTRRDDRTLPECVEMHPNLTVRHVAAGPPEAIPKDELLPYMPELGRQLLAAWSETRPAEDGPMSMTAMKGSCDTPAVRHVPRFSVFIKTDLPPPGCAKTRSNHVVVTFVPVW